MSTVTGFVQVQLEIVDGGVTEFIQSEKLEFYESDNPKKNQVLSMFHHINA